MGEWVGEIRFEPEVEWKIHQPDHGGLTPTEVRRAVSCNAHDQADWDDDDRYGRRLILTGSDDHGELVAYLRPIDQEDGLWECLTAWRI